MDLVGNFTKDGELFLELFAGNFAISKASMLLPKHDNFVWFYKRDDLRENQILV